MGGTCVNLLDNRGDPLPERDNGPAAREGAPSERSFYNRGGFGVGGGPGTPPGDTRVTNKAMQFSEHQCWRTERGGNEETRGELKRQLQNCPWTDGKHASEENERMRMKERVTDMMTHIHKADINKHTSFRLQLQITGTAHTHTDGWVQEEATVSPGSLCMTQ